MNSKFNHLYIKYPTKIFKFLFECLSIYKSVLLLFDKDGMKTCIPDENISSINNSLFIQKFTEYILKVPNKSIFISDIKMFIIYINSINKNINNKYIELYASDDNSIILSNGKDLTFSIITSNNYNFNEKKIISDNIFNNCFALIYPKNPSILGITFKNIKKIKNTNNKNNIIIEFIKLAETKENPEIRKNFCILFNSQDSKIYNDIQCEVELDESFKNKTFIKTYDCSLISIVSLLKCFQYFNEKHFKIALTDDDIYFYFEYSDGFYIISKISCFK